VISNSFYGLNILIKYRYVNGFRAILLKSTSNNLFVLNQVILDNIELNSNLEPSLIKLNNEGDTYIANVIENGTSQTVGYSTESLQVKDADMNLNLNDQFFYLHIVNQNMLNSPKFPEFMIANGYFLNLYFSSFVTFSNFFYAQRSKFIFQTVCLRFNRQ
jgi:hypothetical protein